MRNKHSNKVLFLRVINDRDFLVCQISITTSLFGRAMALIGFSGCREW